MKFWDSSKTLFLLLVASLFFFSCEKEKINNDDQGFPIELTVTKPGRNVMLEWTKTNISNFESYMIVRSPEPIEDTPEPVGTFEVIDDFEENTFEDFSFPLTEELYYKVYVKFGDRFLFSPTVSVQFDVNLLDLRVSRVVYDEGSDLVFMYDNNQQSIFRYDIGAGEITHTFSEPSVFDYIMDVGDAGLGTELFLCPNGNSIVEIYDDQFNFKQSFSTFSSITDIDHSDGVILVSKSNSNSSIEIIERSSLDDIEAISGNSAFERRIKRLPSTDRRVVEINFSGLFLHEFDANWNLTSTNVAPVFTSPLNEIVTSPDGEHFIPNQEGMIFNADLEQVGSASDPAVGGAQDYLFSKDGSKVYAFQFSTEEIVELSFPELEELRTIPLNYLPFKAFLKESGEIVIVGRVFTTFPERTIIDVLDLE